MNAQLCEWTVKRRLQAEGTTLRALGRGPQAEALPAEDALTIAGQLGFSDLSSFSQSFKRWTGISPSRYRSRARATVSGD